jgi:hypothetical protein
MKNKTVKINKIALAAMIGAAALTTAAYADDIESFTADWSGTPFSDSASATATFDLDITAIDAALNNNTGGFYNGALDGYISDLSMTVTGASSGNGTFTTSDFNEFYFTTGGPIDFGSDWVPQPNLEDFNLFSSDNAPLGVEEEVLATDSGDGDIMQLTSVTPAPEPSTLELAGLGALSSLFLFRRRKLSRA